MTKQEQTDAINMLLTIECKVSEAPKIINVINLLSAQTPEDQQ